MHVLVVGAGVAGLTLALCLCRRGHTVTVLDRARQGGDAGYMLDFFGSGYDVAERLELTKALEAVHRQVPTLTFVRPDGQVRFGLSYAEMRKRLFHDRHFNFMRGDLAHVLRDALGGRANLRLGTVEWFEDDGRRVFARLTDGTSVEADLLVGADGVHSQVRRLVFGAERHFLRQLGYHTAAFAVEDEALGRQIGATFATLSMPGRQVAIYPVRGATVATFWIHRAPGPIDDASAAGARKALRTVYGSLGWVVPWLLKRAEELEHLYFDTVSQVELPAWSRGRVVLCGDACQAVSLIAGQGASMAMGGAWVLAEELQAAGPDIAAGLARYEKRMRPAIAVKQRAGRRMAKWFVPASSLRLTVRDALLRWSSSAAGAWVVRRELAADSVLGS